MEPSVLPRSALAPEPWVWIPSSEDGPRTEEKKLKKRGSPLFASPRIVSPESKRWFVVSRQQPVKRLLRDLDLIWDFASRMACIQLRWVVSPSVTVTDEIQMSQRGVLLVYRPKSTNQEKGNNPAEVFVPLKRADYMQKIYTDYENLMQRRPVFGSVSFTLSHS